jgi:group I intron endonuclease
LNGVPKYVGFTIRPIAVRWKQHIYHARIKKSCPLLQNAINKYGPEAFTITEIYSSEDIDHTLNVMEPQFIREHKTHVDDGGYNLSVGGEKGWLGRKHTQETKQKMRLAQLGKKKPNVIRKPHSEETKQKIRLARLGKPRGPHSEERKQKIREALTGKPLSEERKQKISKTLMGRKYPNRKHSKDTSSLPTCPCSPNHPIRSFHTSTPSTLASFPAPAP